MKRAECENRSKTLNQIDLGAKMSLPSMFRGIWCAISASSEISRSIHSGGGLRPTSWPLCCFKGIKIHLLLAHTFSHQNWRPPCQWIWFFPFTHTISAPDEYAWRWKEHFTDYRLRVFEMTGKLCSKPSVPIWWMACMPEQQNAAETRQKQLGGGDKGMCALRVDVLLGFNSLERVNWYTVVKKRLLCWSTMPESTVRRWRVWDRWRVNSLKSEQIFIHRLCLFCFAEKQEICK